LRSIWTPRKTPVSAHDGGLGPLLGELGAFDAPLAPMDAHEVWAAGVTYVRSRTARAEESAGSGASAFYDRVYDAPRPELFFKATPSCVVGHDVTARDIEAANPLYLPRPRSTPRAVRSARRCSPAATPRPCAR
jgi:fumarylacetoacetate (FAA) hydrolase family protein